MPSTTMRPGSRATPRAAFTISLRPEQLALTRNLRWVHAPSAAVHQLLAKKPGENVFAGPGHTLDGQGNFLWSPSKFVAAIGVRDLIVVETPDALLICPRDRAQEVGKIVKWLEEQKLRKLL